MILVSKKDIKIGSSKNINKAEAHQKKSTKSWPPATPPEALAVPQMHLMKNRFRE